jgi:hypothetical protein
MCAALSKLALSFTGTTMDTAGSRWLLCDVPNRHSTVALAG